MSQLPPGYERRYLAGGYRAHVVDIRLQSTVALCGRAVIGFWDWRGTGSGYEASRAAGLMLCKECDRRVDPILRQIARQREEAADAQARREPARAGGTPDARTA